MARTPPTRTLLLRERTTTECRLAAADLAFLLAGHRRHVQVVPAQRRGCWRLTPTGHVGTIVTPSCRLVIQPKLPLSNLFDLLDPAGPIPTVADHVQTAPGNEVFDFLASRLAHLLGELAAAGLHRAYVERTGQNRFLHGRPDVAANVRDLPRSKDRPHSRYEDFTCDVPCNQVPKAVAEHVLRSPLLAESVRDALWQVLRPFAEVVSVPLTPDSFAGAERIPDAYRPLWDVCRLLADGLTAATAAGLSPYPAFLVDMERVFERYLTWHLAEHFGAADQTSRGWHLLVQPLVSARGIAAGQPELTVRPDLVLERHETPVLVVDAKWKRLPRGRLVTADVYQVLGYCAALGVRRAVLVYPGRRATAWCYHLEQSGVRVEVRTLRVVGPRAVCRRSVQRLARALEQEVRA